MFARLLPDGSGPSVGYNGIVNYLSLGTSVTLRNATCRTTPVTSATAFVIANRVGVCPLPSVCPPGTASQSAIGFDQARVSVAIGWPNECEVSLPFTSSVGGTSGVARAQASEQGESVCVESWGNISAVARFQQFPFNTATFLANTSSSAAFRWACDQIDADGPPVADVDMCITGYAIQINCFASTREGLLLSSVLGAQVRATSTNTGNLIRNFGLVRPSDGSPIRIGETSFDVQQGFELTVEDVFIFGPDLDGNGCVNHLDRKELSRLLGTNINDVDYRLRVDLNYDGAVNLDDWMVYCPQWVAALPCCPADYNADSTVDPDDVADFVSDYFSQNISADLDCSGSLDPDDLSDYISLYYANIGPCPCQCP